eukprot:jgi/Botrbrau1/11898/Bobra.0171s0009.1
MPGGVQTAARAPRSVPRTCCSAAADWTDVPELNRRNALILSLASAAFSPSSAFADEVLNLRPCMGPPARQPVTVDMVERKRICQVLLRCTASNWKT